LAHLPRRRLRQTLACCQPSPQYRFRLSRRSMSDSMTPGSRPEIRPRARGRTANYLADLQADVGDIVGEGLAWRQIVVSSITGAEFQPQTKRNALRARVIAISPTEAAKRILQGETGIVIESPLAASRIVLEDSGFRGRGLNLGGQRGRCCRAQPGRTPCHRIQPTFPELDRRRPYCQWCRLSPE
jgi:hypothetical protein